MSTAIAKIFSECRGHFFMFIFSLFISIVLHFFYSQSAILFYALAFHDCFERSSVSRLMSVAVIFAPLSLSLVKVKIL